MSNPGMTHLLRTISRQGMTARLEGLLVGVNPVTWANNTTSDDGSCLVGQNIRTLRGIPAYRTYLANPTEGVAHD
jgi:2-keto-3-deoxy-galactonokinase